MRPRQFSESHRNQRISHNLVDKYRDYVRHLTKNYTLTDEELDNFVENWDQNIDIREMSLSLVVEDEPDNKDTMTAEQELELEMRRKRGNSIKDMRVSITGLSENKGILELLKQIDVKVSFPKIPINSNCLKQ